MEKRESEWARKQAEWARKKAEREAIGIEKARERRKREEMKAAERDTQRQQDIEKRQKKRKEMKKEMQTIRRDFCRYLAEETEESMADAYGLLDSLGELLPFQGGGEHFMTVKEAATMLEWAKWVISEDRKNEDGYIIRTTRGLTNVGKCYVWHRADMVMLRMLKEGEMMIDECVNSVASGTNNGMSPKS